MTTIEAIFQGGTFQPIGPVDLPEHQRVRLQVESVAASTDFDAWLARVRPVQEEMRAKYGVLPDSAPLIAEDRRRDD